MRLMKLVFVATAVVLFAIPRPGAGNDPPPAATQPAEHVRAFLTKHCQECHAGEKPKGDFRIEQLGANFDSQAIRERWLAALKRVKVGEMPPKIIKRHADVQLERSRHRTQPRR